MSSMRSEYRPSIAGHDRCDNRDFMHKRVAVTRLRKQGDQKRRHASAAEQDAANSSRGLQSERGEQTAQAHTG